MDALKTMEVMTMKTDIAMISNGNNGLIYRCLLSISSHISSRELGTIALAWNGDKKELEKVKKHASGLNLQLKAIETPYHFSKNNNKLVDELCGSECIMFLNDDVELKDNFAHQAMNILVHDSSSGFVGCKLVRGDDTIQHAGVIAFVDEAGNLVGPAHWFYDHKDSKDIPDITPLAVTGACMMCRRELFNALGGFNEEYEEGFQDFELCLKAVMENKMNICLNSCSQLHDESATRNPKVLPRDSEALAAFWRKSIPKLMKSSSRSCIGIVERN